MMLTTKLSRSISVSTPDGLILYWYELQQIALKTNVFQRKTFHDIGIIAIYNATMICYQELKFWHTAL